MVTCTSCGSDVTGKKFCPECGTPVRPVGTSAVSGSMCPRCNEVVKPGASFCMNCGAALNAQAQVPPPPPLTRRCPSCQVEVSSASAFCTNCGYNMHVAVAPAICPNCGRQNNPGTKFCGGCGSQIAPAQSVPMPQTNYGQSAGQYVQQLQSQYPQSYPQQQYPQQYGQPQYPQGGYQMQPMVGQAPMMLRCPTCMAMAPLGTAYCQSCRTSLAGVVPVPANMPAQGQQGGLGGFLQGSGGKMAMGALGGAAAVIGGEMLLNGLENSIERRVEGDMGFGGQHHHHRQDDDDGLLGNLGRLADDVGLI
jgi:predicted amidophosphoribosyltransferase